MALTVSALADQAGLSADTIRYYERVGLLSEPARSAAGYRLYDQDAVGRLRLIKGAQRAGLRLREIGELLQVADRGQCPCGHTETLLRERLAEVRAELARLQALEPSSPGCWSTIPTRPAPRRSPRRPTGGAPPTALTPASHRKGGDRHAAAGLAKDADKLECLIQAREYQAQGHEDVPPWIETSAAALQPPSARQLAEACQQVPPRQWWKAFAESCPRPVKTSGDSV